MGTIKLNILMMAGNPSETEHPEISVTDSVTLEARVILFNDDWHTFDEVIFQLMKALNCSAERAESYAMEAHTRGKACVFSGDMESCLKVSAVLEEIALHVQVEC